ncbi:MAG TPA: nucleotidyltransferase family protein [Candidatus Limnocylindrales bacterium]|nr:nucleotidyltransferase family protein [Candidatus Limnocylindrales bacterium]
MKAMVLAAGLGTRLRPLTNDRPKALVEIHGHTLLEMTLMRLREFGIKEAIVNAHHFADRMIQYLREHGNFGMKIEVSREDMLLDTGGGLKRAGWFFQDSPEPFLLHNVDVLSNIDLAALVDSHHVSGALATLAVQARQTSRYLLFDNRMFLCGRRKGEAGKPEMARPSKALHAFAFSGIHVISPRLLTQISEQGVFSIIDVYLRLAAAGEKITGFRADQYYWRDLGTPQSLEQAAQDMERKLVS